MDENKNSKNRIVKFTILLIVIIILLLSIKCCNNKTYEITFKDYDGTVLDVQEVKKGEIPVFKGVLQRDKDEKYEYFFFSWDKEIVKATKDETYTAVYTSSLIDKDKNDDSKDKKKSDSVIQDKVDDKNKDLYYVITFLDDDGLMLKSSSYKYGTTPSFSAPDKIVGNYKYTFSSWTPTISKVTSNKTYIATYDKTKINSRNVPSIPTVIYKDSTGSTIRQNIPSGTTISFSSGDHGVYATPLSPITLTNNQTLDLTSDTYKPIANIGYIFKGYTYDDGTNTFTAVYGVACTVTFDVQSHGTAPDSQIIATGEKATEPTAPSEANITFAGWYKEAACINAWNFATDTVMADITLYAKWTVDVTFNVQGKGTAPDTQTIIVGSKATKPTDPTCTDYAFKGWYKEAACTNAWDFDNDTVTEDATLYAKWVDAYTVTFDVQSHGTAPDSQIIATGEKATKPTDPTCTDYAFKGWYKEAACTNAWDFDNDTVTKDATLYAKWVDAYTVTFDVQSHGTAPDSQSIESGSKVTKPTDPTCTGYVFKGWYKEAACTNAWNFDSDTVSADATLYAKWYSDLGEQIVKANRVYRDGEYKCRSDSEHSVISVNGVECFVLKVDEANNKAKLITKAVYESGLLSTSSEAYRKYPTSDLHTFMETFYNTYLKNNDGTDYTILNTTVTYYYTNSELKGPFTTDTLDTYTSDTLADQKVFALEADEAIENKGNFKWTASEYKLNGQNASYFWINAVGTGNNGKNAFLVITCTGGCSSYFTNNMNTGARPVFWISLK